MKGELWDESGAKFIRTFEGEPECGEDFCDRCGDCLHCYGWLPCMDEGEHRWVQYGEKEVV